MQYRFFPPLERTVSAVGFGTWALGGEKYFGGREIGWGPVDSQEAERAVNLALDQGINFFDTADIYGGGRAEETLGKVFSERHSDVVVCTKFGNREDASGKAIKDFSAHWLNHSVHESLKRLQRDWLDILLLHGPPESMVWNGFDVEPLERLVESGKIRCYGVSSQSVSGACSVVRYGLGSVSEFIYNVLDRRAEDKLLPLALQEQTGCIARVPLASGFLTNSRVSQEPEFAETDFRAHLSQEERAWRLESAKKLAFLCDAPGGLEGSALRFCLSHPGIGTVIPGMRTQKQVERNLRIADQGPLAPEVLEKIQYLIPKPYAGWLN
jgi:aryl-alcohol dehydrogenase-like predicted oxidoreductase